MSLDVHDDTDSDGMVNIDGNLRRNVVLACLVACLFFVSNCNGLTFVGPFAANFSAVVHGDFVLTPMLPGYGVSDWAPITTELAMWYTNYTGKALVLDMADHGYSPEETCRRALANGTLHGIGMPAIIIQPSPIGFPGFTKYASDDSDMTWVNLPTVDASIYLFALAKVMDGLGVPVLVTIRNDDINPMWTQWSYPAIVISALILTALCLCTTTVNLFKTYWHYKMTGTTITTAKVYLAVDLLANFMRFWYICVDPYFSNSFGYLWTTMCSTTHVPLSQICALLLALKWRELLLRSKLKVTVFLSVYKWPFIVAAILIFAMEAISSALRGHFYSISQLSLISWNFLIVVCWIIVVLLYVSGIQIMLHIKNAVGSKRKLLQLSVTTLCILAGGGFLLFWAIVEMAFLIKAYGYVTSLSLRDVQVCTMLQFAGLFISSFLWNWAMPIPYDSSARTSAAHTVSKTDQTNKASLMALSKTVEGETEADDADEESETTELNAMEEEEKAESSEEV